MNRVLVAYATSSGSTADVAQAIAEEIAKQGVQVEVLPVDQVKTLEGYSAVVAGGPMIMGWHRAAVGFLKQHRQALQAIPFAVFVTAMSLTQTGESSVGGAPAYVDARLPVPPKRTGHLSLRERYATVGNYARPILGAARPARPASIGFFGGRLDYGRLKWWGVLFAMVVIGATPGERRNWPAIRAWAAALPEALGLPVAASMAEPQAEALPEPA